MHRSPHPHEYHMSIHSTQVRNHDPGCAVFKVLQTRTYKDKTNPGLLTAYTGLTDHIVSPAYNVVFRFSS